MEFPYGRQPHHRREDHEEERREHQHHHQGFQPSPDFPDRPSAGEYYPPPGTQFPEPGYYPPPPQHKRQRGEDHEEEQRQRGEDRHHQGFQLSRNFSHRPSAGEYYPPPGTQFPEPGYYPPPPQPQRTQFPEPGYYSPTPQPQPQPQRTQFPEPGYYPPTPQLTQFPEPGYYPPPPQPQPQPQPQWTQFPEPGYYPPPPQPQPQPQGSLARPGYGPPGGSFLRPGGEPDLRQGPVVRVLTKANPDFSLTIRNGSAVLVHANANDKHQQWVMYKRDITKVKIDERCLPFYLVNNATGEALQHGIGETQPVLLIEYQPNTFDESILWTVNREMGQGYIRIRPVNNIHLNLDAFHGDKKSVGIKDGNPVFLRSWKKGDNQLWKIGP